MIPHVNDSKEELVDMEENYQYEPGKRIKWYDRILLNRPLKVALAFLITAVVAPLLIYQFYFFTSLNLPPSDGYSVGSCLVPRQARLACGVGLMTEQECHPHCCFDLNLNMCFHRLPSRFSYIMNQPWNEYVTLQPRIATVPYKMQNSIPKIKLSIDERSATHLTLTYYNSRNLSLFGERVYEKKYSYEVASPEMNVVVNASQGTIFNMARGPLIASDNIWEITFILTNESMYGLGELPLKQGTVKVLYNHENGFSSIPLIFARVNGSYHGLLIDTSDPTEITINMQNHIIIRSITNFGFKLHLFVGPEPKYIMRDVMTITGQNKQLEYWMLGAHVCNELEEMDLRSFLANATREGMPYESHCGHKPIIFNSDNCASNEIIDTEMVENGATLVKNANKRFIPHISPYIRFIKEEVNITEEVTGNATIQSDTSCKIIPGFEDLMYRFPNTLEVYTGRVDDYDVIYPNYDKVSEEFMGNLWTYNSNLDGVILENSWPLDQTEKMHNETAQYLPYFNENFEKVFEHTPQWNLTTINDTEIYLYKHNTYGNSFTKAFQMVKNVTPIWSSNIWMNGAFTLNKQNIDTSWTNLHKELISAALGGISGYWFWSTPICGDTENFDLENQATLCAKWYMAATYFPLIKIHSKKVPRYPFAFSGTHKALAIKALERRMSLMPYFYSTFQEGPLLRPMFYQFPMSEGIQDLNSQFSVGDDLLIVPNLQPFQSHVHVWLPPGSWYEFWSGLKLEGNEGDAVTMNTAESDFLTLIRGGSIIPIQKDVYNNVEDTRFQTSFSLIIALECAGNNETTCEASGKLFISEKMTLIFQANSFNLTITADGKDFDPICDINTGTWAYDIRIFSIYGLNEEYNNYDHHREVNSFTDLCNLEYDDNIIIQLLT